MDLKTFLFHDAKFKFENKTVIMSFHNICGPIFEVINGRELKELHPDGSEKYNDLWSQYYSWWNKKGKYIYD